MASRWVTALMVALLGTAAVSWAGEINAFPEVDDSDPEVKKALKNVEPPKRTPPPPCQVECSKKISTCTMSCGAADEKDMDDKKAEKDLKDKKLSKRQLSKTDECHQKCALQQQKCLAACK